MPTPQPPQDNWLWNDTPVPSNRPATPVQVARFDSGAAAGSRFQILDNLECLAVYRSIGTDPGRATFRYRFTGLDPQAPQSIEQALSTAVNLPKTVNPNDELVVKATRPDGTSEFVFHGKALGFGLVLEAGREEAVVQAVGIAKDLWDSPIAGAYLRDASDITGGKDFQSDLVAQFNPKGEPNATDQPAWAQGEPPAGQQGDFTYPTFLDPTIVRSPDPRKPWTLATSARFLIFRHVDAGTRVVMPTGDELDGLLQSLEPTGAVFDPTDPTTYTAKPIVVSDKPITGRDWPSTLNELIRDRGFGMEFEVGTAADGTSPETTLRVFRLQLGDKKSIFLQGRGSYFDPTLSNVIEAEITRDATQCVNQWDVVGALNRYEAGFILESGFPMVASDAGSIAALAKFDRSSKDFEGSNDAYRLFVFDETGEGHYAQGTSEAITTVPSLDDILGKPDQDGKPQYTGRRRKPIGQLFSIDGNGKPRQYQLAISPDYMGPKPGIWDGTGTWQVIEGGYAPLKDRNGIRITADNPNAWKIGKSDEANAPYPTGIVKVVESLAAPGAANKPFSLRWTAVVEGDLAVRGTASKTDASVLTQTIARTIDAKDRYKKNTICKSSAFAPPQDQGDNGSGDIIDRDDTDDAVAEATANRAASEAGVLEGPMTIPRFTMFYKIGDRVDQIAGRGLAFRTDNGTGASGKGAIYPVIVGIDHVFSPEQKTILHLSDQDGHRHKIERKIKRGR